MAMMESIRNQAQSGLSYILVGVLIVFFAVFFGVPADGCRAPGGRAHMATAFGDQIHTEDVRVVYNRFFGGQTSTVDEDIFVQQQASSLKVILTTYALAHRAKEMGLRVSDEEFVAFLTDPNRNLEFLLRYGRTGELDGPQYERYVRYGLQTPIPQYEEYKRMELLARKYMVMLDMQIQATQAEIDELHRLRNTRVNLEFVRFSEERLSDVLGVDDETVATFLEEHADRVAAFYEEHADDYRSEDRVELRRIYVIKAEEEPAASEALQRYEDARRRVMDDGEDFATVAQEVSEDMNRDEGGLMGWSSISNLDQAIATAIEGAGPGDLVEAESDFAYMLVKIEDREEATLTPLEEVQDDIARHLIGEDLVSQRGAELAEILRARVADGSTLADALADLEEEAIAEEREEDAAIWAALTPQTTGFFNLEGDRVPAQLRAQFGADFSFGRSWDEVPRLGQNRDLALAAFRLTAENPLMDGIVELDDAVAVIRLADREDPDDLDAEARAELKLEIRETKVEELLGPWRNFFENPTQPYGHFLDQVLRDAIDSGQIRLREQTSTAAVLVRQQLDAPEEELGGTLELQ